MGFWRGMAAVGALGAIAIGVGYSQGAFEFLEDVAEEVVLSDRWGLRWQALDVSTRSHDLADDGWTAIAGVNNAAIDALFDGVEGAMLTNTGGGLLEGATVTVQNVDITPGLGAMDAMIELTARKGPLTVGLNLEGAVLVTAIRNVERQLGGGADTRVVPVTEIAFRIEPTRVAPTLGVSSLERKKRGLWSDLAPGLASALLSDELFTVTMDLPREVRVDLGVDRTETQTIDEERGATATYRVTLKESQVTARFAYGAPIYTGDAVWVMARDVDAAAPDVVAATPPKGDAATLEAAARALEDALQARLSQNLRELGEADRPRIAVDLDGRVLSRIGDKLAALPPDKQRVNVRLVNWNGRLAEDQWRDNLLGEGGVYVEIGCPDCAEFNAGLSDARFEVRDGRHVLAAEVAVSGWVNIAAHVDPLVSGGAGTSVRIEGGTQGAQTVAAEINATVLRDENGHSVGALTWQPSCRKLEVVATSDGRLKFDFGWMRMPRVGARMDMVVGPSVIEPIVVLEEAPSFVAHPAPRALAKDGEGPNWRLVFPNLVSVVTVEPADFALVGGRLRAAADLGVVHHLNDTGSEEARAEALAAIEKTVDAARDAAADATDALVEKHQEGSRCKDVAPSVRVLLGDIEVGPNNEVVKFLRNAWNDIVNGPGPNNEIVEFLNGVGETFHHAAAIAAGLMENVEKRGNNLVNPAPDSAMHKPLEKPGKTIECIATLFNSC